jgi:MFS-type transporter involved in bile tolerance (Atg22 family)
MFSFGYITEMFNGSQRQSVLALMAFFFVGFLLLLFTIKKQKSFK